MIETEHRRVAASSSDQWLADLATAGGDRDVYAERRDTKAYAAAGVLRSREAGMTDRYDRNGHELRDGHSETVSKHAQAEQVQAYQDDYYGDYQDVATRQSKAYVFDDEREEQGPEWVYDEQRGVWVDRDGNPYVEAYPEGEEDRYAPAADDEYLAPRAEARVPRRKSRGSAVSLAALVLVASIGGGMAYVWKKGGFVGSDIPGIGSEPPVIKASTDPVKIKPAETATVASQPTHEIFNRSSQTASVADERLVRHEEQPVAVVPTRPEGAAAPAAPDADATRPVTTSNIVLPNPEGTAAPDQTASNASETQIAQAPDEPRRVKTIKIMPDSSVVTGEAPITSAEPRAPQTRSVDVSALAPTPPAGQPSSEAAPPAPVVAPEAAPLVQGEAGQASPPASAGPVATVPADSAAASPDEQASAQALPGEEDGATTLVEPTQTQVAPPAVPPVRPRHMPPAPKPAQVASAEPAAGAAPAPATVAAPVANGSYVVQVSSQRSPADAQNAFQSLQRRFAGVLGGMKPSIRKVDLPDRGTYYRVRVGGWSTPAEATAFCGKLKAAGGDCVIARN
ncbi:SPOR domain-containing protein [Labrys sp. LIt4]|uniref:SPOR domain-containing protein n=1 Tax=Labrys sp. LIt4 TaxID=2821355 RepID=UPI001ADEC60A|nr:SPOR domain-containing protein [Labrys sp. LIt4]MBP0580880.1 SPOR domain-containing protein [Labrys sp. LIt4]